MWIKDRAMAIRILIVDDHAIVRQGLQLFLSTDPELQIVGEAVNGQEAVDMALRTQPDVILMDLLMPVMNGVEATGAIKRKLPDTEIIALTSVIDDASVVNAVRAGAIGYLLKDTEVPDLIRAIKAAASGQVQLAPKAALRLVAEIRQPQSPDKLTEREIDVLRLVARGKANKEIARELGIGEKTVKSHVSNILSKLGVSSRTQASLYAASIGLIESSESGGGSTS
jgi:DNA-binding NarL/FixJ family response regulator